MLVPAVLALGAALVLQQSDARVHASLSDDRISVGGSTLLQVTVEASGGRPDEIDLPAMPPSFDVLSSREYLQTQLSLPGGRTTVIRRDIVLRARSEGSFTIAPVIVRLRDGTVLRTRPLSLRVVATAVPGAPGAPPLPGTTPPTTSTGGVNAGELRVTVVPDTAWLGEPVLLRMTALIPEAQRTRRGRSPSFEPPAGSGFWVQEVEDRGAVGVRAFGSQYYDVHEYRRLYVPLTAGTHSLSAGRAVYEVDRGWMFAPETYELVSDPVELPVRALPADGRPASFTGAVGTFDVRAQLDRASLAPGDAATLTVEIEGSGNIKALPAPRIPGIPGVEVFSPTEDASFTARTSGIRGTKTFRWVLVPDRAGTITLPAIEYAWFDPEDARYHSERVELPALIVEGEVATTATKDTALAPVRTAAQPRPPFEWAAGRLFLLMQLVPLLLIAAAMTWRSRAPRVRARRAVRQGREEGFARARARAPSDPRSALGDLEHALGAAVGALTGDSAANVEALRARGVSTAELTSLAALRDAIRVLRFRPQPAGVGEVEALVQRAEVLMRRLDRSMRARRPAAVSVLLPLLLLAPAAPASTAQGSAFARAVAAYQHGAYDDARIGFVAHLEDHPLDAAAWYNLGNTDFRRSMRGAAVHAWARALWLQPRADDARHNLRAVGAGDAIAIARRPVPLTANELRALAGLAWLLGGTLLALRLAGRARVARLAGYAGSAFVLLAGVALLALAARVTWPQSAIVVRDVSARTGPALRADTRGTLAAGEVVRIVAWREGWAHIRTMDDEGWIETRDLGRIQ